MKTPLFLLLFPTNLIFPRYLNANPITCAILPPFRETLCIKAREWNLLPIVRFNHRDINMPNHLQ